LPFTQLTQVSRLGASDTTMSIHVLENHLFLLKGLKASRPNIRLRKAKCFVSRGAQVINPTALFPFGLNQPSFCQALQRSSRVTYRSASR
jgi:hypothetical protein